MSLFLLQSQQDNERLKREISELHDLIKAYQSKDDIDIRHHSGIAKQYFKLIHQLNFTLKERILALKDICWLNPHQDIYRLSLIASYYQAQEWHNAYQECYNIKKNHTLDFLSLKAKCCYRLGEAEKNIEKKILYYFEAMQALNEINEKFPNTEDKKCKEKISEQLIYFYFFMLERYERELYETYKEAAVAVNLLKKIKMVLPEKQLPNVTSIEYYPKLILATDLEEMIFRLIQERYPQNACLFSTKQKKGRHIREAMVRAKKHFSDDIVNLLSFLNFKENQPSILDTLQESRWGKSGPNVPSYQLVIERLNSYSLGLGDAIINQHVFFNQNEKVVYTKKILAQKNILSEKRDTKL